MPTAFLIRMEIRRNENFEIKIRGKTGVFGTYPQFPCINLIYLVKIQQLFDFFL